MTNTNYSREEKMVRAFCESIGFEINGKLHLDGPTRLGLFWVDEEANFSFCLEWADRADHSKGYKPNVWIRDLHTGDSITA